MLMNFAAAPARAGATGDTKRGVLLGGVMEGIRISLVPSSASITEPSRGEKGGWMGWMNARMHMNMYSAATQEAAHYARMECMMMTSE